MLIFGLFAAIVGTVFTDPGMVAAGGSGARRGKGLLAEQEHARRAQLAELLKQPPPRDSGWSALLHSASKPPDPAHAQMWTATKHSSSPHSVMRCFMHLAWTGSTDICPSCLLPRPPGSKHSQVADGCVLGFDHDCPYLLAAIGKENYRYYLLTLTMLMCNVVLGLEPVCSAFMFIRRQSVMQLSSVTDSIPADE